MTTSGGSIRHPGLEAAARWQLARDRLVAAGPDFTKAEDAFFREGTAAEAAYQLAEEERERLHEALQSARSQVYRTKPENLSDVLALLNVVRAAEEDLFEDPELAEVFDNVIGRIKIELRIGPI